jgi:hypothetical protein
VRGKASCWDIGCWAIMGRRVCLVDETTGPVKGFWNNRNIRTNFGEFIYILISIKTDGGTKSSDTYYGSEGRPRVVQILPETATDPKGHCTSGVLDCATPSCEDPMLAADCCSNRQLSHVPHWAHVLLRLYPNLVAVSSIYSQDLHKALGRSEGQG